MAVPIISAGRFSPLGPLGIALLISGNELVKQLNVFHCPNYQLIGDVNLVTEHSLAFLEASRRSSTAIARLCRHQIICSSNWPMPLNMAL